MKQTRIMILGVGNLLLTDEGFGIHVVNALQAGYDFGENVSVVDGGVLGMNLLGVICDVDHLIVVDIIRNNGEPGTLYRIDHEDIPQRVRAKNSLHQIDFLEAMTFCRHGLDKEPRAVIFGVEPLDMETFSIEMTPLIRSQVDVVIQKVLEEVERHGGTFTPLGDPIKHVSGNPLQNH